MSVTETESQSSCRGCCTRCGWTSRPAPRWPRAACFSTIGLLAQGILRFATAFLIGHIAGKSELGVVASAIATGATAGPAVADDDRQRGVEVPRQGTRGGQRDEIRSIAAHLRLRTIQTAVLLGVASLPIWVLIDHGSWAERAERGRR